MTQRYEVYWIHLPEHTDVTLQGYVGLTKQGTKQRFWSHKNSSKNPINSHKIISKAFNKYGERLVVKTLVVCDKDYAKYLENALRPKDFIGWNMNSGGYTPSERTPEQRRIAADKRRKTMEGRDLGGENHWNWKGGVTKDRYKPFTPERRKQAQAITAEKLRGRKASEETRIKQSKAKLGMFSGDNNPFADSTQYTFIRVSDGLVEFCTRSALREKYKLSRTFNSLFGKSPQKTALGWRLQ